MDSFGDGGEGIEAATPDLLKNTPSNIARLEDLIEHSKGRLKYLARTRSPSDGSDVRWYFCEVPLGVNELAASIPRTEVVGKGEYFRFGMRDSLAIEASFLQKEEELLSCWWREFAECSEGPRSRLDPNSKDLQSKVQLSQLYTVEDERVGVPVKGGLYEVDLVRRHCFPVYWNGENRRVLRGHWFARKGGLDWLPMREDVAEQLEYAYQKQVWHRRTFQPSGLFAARVDLQGSTPGLHALFTGEDDTWEAYLNVDSSGFSGAFGFGGGGIKLRRGYSRSESSKPTQDELRQQKEEEMDDYCSQVPVGHLVFMVHGIGQRLEKSNLVDDVSNFRHITATMSERHLTPYQRGTQRVLFIPCQWRKGLKLSGETAVDKITLDGVRGLRTTLSATVHDVLYYMSPIYCQDIIDSVSNQLNMLYLKFLKRNPGYEGKVSLYGHSLGSVLSYDILCHQETLSSPFPMDDLYTSGEMSGKVLQNSDQVSTSNAWTNFSERQTPRKLHSVEEKEQSNSMLRENEKEASKSIPFAALSSAEQSPVAELDRAKSSEDAFVCSLNNFVSGNDSEDGETLDQPHSDNEKKLSKFTKLENEEESSQDVPFAASTRLDFTEQSPVTDCHQTKIGEDVVGCSSKVNGVVQEKGSLAEGSPNCGTPRVNLCEGQQASSIDVTNAVKVVELLKEEINSLKTRIAILESQQAETESTASGKGIARRSYTPYIRYTKLEFQVDTFFAVGSPLGVFLALRNIRIGIGKGKDYWGEENIVEEMPACRQMFNIFHPFDPVAYRIEPLVCKEYIEKRPVIIPYHRGGKRLHTGFQEFTEGVAARSQAVVDRLNSVRVSVLTVCQSKSKDRLEDAEETGKEEKSKSYGALMMERLTGSKEGRIDHTLQDKTFRHPYLSVLGSHTNYWRDSDTALFILKHLYWDIPQEPLSAKNSALAKMKGVFTSSWRDAKVAAEEELPLTFSDSNAAKNLSGKAKENVNL
ncbi:hypothetical protein MLD38_001188 [Melastoma candidum]|uniref:Uncharacterized protein n=1 Tax=Melastoma candidum TaxID=119954 RepID=A0ACB9SCH3_9MYRT|nr:hypothetical protein MLD38_001188 [Melastoma candidum]